MSFSLPNAGTKTPHSTIAGILRNEPFVPEKTEMNVGLDGLLLIAYSNQSSLCGLPLLIIDLILTMVLRS